MRRASRRQCSARILEATLLAPLLVAVLLKYDAATSACVSYTLSFIDMCLNHACVR